MKPKKLVVHVAEVDIRQDTGMGRVAWHWREAFQCTGHEFVHIGPSAVGPVAHPGWFPLRAWQAYKRMKRQADVFLVHEPASGAFVRRGIPSVVFSHGLERRGWQQRTVNSRLFGGPPSLKTRLLFPMWRLRQCERGIRNADCLLLINREDAGFAQTYYGRREQDIFLFRNGIDPVPLRSSDEPQAFTILFSGSWIARKGTETLARVAAMLEEKRVPVNWVLAGTQCDASVILNRWPRALHASTQVIPSFSREQECDLLAGASLFLLPSLYEGQPLSLLQAMAAARCCVATDCCGQRDLIRHGHNGLLFAVGDASALAGLVEACASDGARRRHLGDQAQASVRGRLWRSVAADVAECVLAV